MGIFSNFFKSKPKPTVDTEIGKFKLIYSNKRKNLWSSIDSSLNKTVRGTDIEPYVDHINFLKDVESRIDSFEKKITNKFKREFDQADLPINIKNWKEKFKIEGLDVMLVSENETFWNITFEDMEEPYYQFTIFIEGEKIGPDFSIDS